jgi:hypothetical protein
VARVRIAIPALAAMMLLLSVPPLAHAAHVTSKKPWAAGNEYLAEATLDGRTQPADKPREKIDWVKKGQWVKIQCQVEGALLSGSRIWDKVGGYYVPDHFIKTYTDGFIQGSPRCAVPPAANPTMPPPPPPPPPAALPPGGDPGTSTPPPTPAPSDGCRETTLSVGPLTATAKCFRRDGKAFVATGQVRVTGVDLRTAGAGAEVRIEPAALEISTTGRTQVSVGGLVLYQRPIEWHVGRQFAFSVERGVKLRGLPITGSATFDVNAGKRSVDIGLNLALPSVLGGVSGATMLRASGAGVAVDNIKVTAGSARLGRFELRDLALSYADVAGIPHFEGQGTLVLPSPLAPVVTARLGFGAGDGYFHAGGEVTKFGRPLAYGVFLQRIRFDITINPVRLSGGIGVSAGPLIFNTEAVAIDGDFTYQEGTPDRYAITGSARIVDIPLASGSVSYQTDGRFDMSALASFKRHGVGFEGSVQGWVDGGNAFNFQGNGSVGLGIFRNGGDAVISSSGVAACRHGRGPDVGFGYGWTTGFPHIFGRSCNIGDWVVANSTRQVGAPTFGSFAIAGGQPAAVFSVVGTLAPPKAILTGPDGAAVAATPDDPAGGVDDGKVLLFQNPEDLTTYIAVKDPAGGLYRMSLKAGSAPASVFRSAQSLAAPRVRARVDGNGRRRALRWTFTPVPGRSVVFYEQGRDTRRRLEATTHRQGRIAFAVPDGRAGRREIIAMVRQDGLTQSAGVVAHYTAPPPRRPGRPGSVRITSRGGVLSARWGRATGAAAYEVRVVLSDGRRLLFLPKKTTRRITVRDVPAGTHVSVTVRGLSATARRGPRAHARLEVRRRR